MSAPWLERCWDRVGVALGERSAEPADCSSSGATALSQQNSSDYFDVFPSRELPCSLQGPPRRHVELRWLLLVISKGRESGEGAVLCRAGAEP